LAESGLPLIPALKGGLRNKASQPYHSSQPRKAGDDLSPGLRRRVDAERKPQGAKDYREKRDAAAIASAKLAIDRRRGRIDR
jgi:hypothetical protein